jgi:putative heme iron utilization protein
MESFYRRNESKSIGFMKAEGKSIGKAWLNKIEIKKWMVELMRQFHPWMIHILILQL